SIQKYKDYLTEEEEKGRFTFNIGKTDNQVIDFFITTEDELTLDNMKLKKNINTSNSVAIDIHGKIKKYDTVEDILDSFCRVRLEYYKIRIKGNIEKLTLLL